MKDFYGLLWLLLTLGPLLFLQRWLHSEILAIFLLLTRRQDISVALFSILFFPGVLLHESSHYGMARLLGVRTGRFSLLPRPLPNGRLQLGFVETTHVDPLRDALIGAAPLITGGLFVAYAGLMQMGLLSLWQAYLADGAQAAFQVMPSVTAQPDFWLWFYLTFTVSSTMLPSPSDRSSWPPLLLVGGILLVMTLLAGAGPWLLENLAPYLNAILASIAVVFGISALLHLLLWLPSLGIRLVISRLTGLKVVSTG